MYLKILYKLRCLGCISKQDKRSAVKNTWSKSLKSIFLAESFSHPSFHKKETEHSFEFSFYDAEKKLSMVSTGDSSPAFMRKNRLA